MKNSQTVSLYLYIAGGNQTGFWGNDLITFYILRSLKLHMNGWGNSTQHWPKNSTQYLCTTNNGVSIDAQPYSHDKIKILKLKL